MSLNTELLPQNCCLSMKESQYALSTCSDCFLAFSFYASGILTLTLRFAWQSVFFSIHQSLLVPILSVVPICVLLAGLPAWFSLLTEACFCIVVTTLPLLTASFFCSLVAAPVLLYLFPAGLSVWAFQLFLVGRTLLVVGVLSFFLAFFSGPVDSKLVEVGMWWSMQWCTLVLLKWRFIADSASIGHLCEVCSCNWEWDI